MNNSMRMERIRELKNKGFSEHDATLKSMRRTKADRKKEEKSYLASPAGDGEEFPYGLRIDLNHDSLQKAGISKLPNVGKAMRLHAKVKVHSAEERSDSRGPRRSLGLQITHMKLK